MFVDLLFTNGGMKFRCKYCWMQNKYHRLRWFTPGNFKAKRELGCGKLVPFNLQQLIYSLERIAIQFALFALSSSSLGQFWINWGCDNIMFKWFSLLNSCMAFDLGNFQHNGCWNLMGCELADLAHLNYKHRVRFEARLTENSIYFKCQPDMSTYGAQRN